MEFVDICEDKADEFLAERVGVEVEGKNVFFEKFDSEVIYF